MTRQKLGKMGERLAAKWLAGYGLKVRHEKRRAKYDIDCMGHRLEVKTAREDRGYWRFNIHRHGVLDERGCDFYLFVLLAADGKPSFYVSRAPIGEKVLSVHRAHLASRTWRSRNIDAFLRHIEPVEDSSLLLGLA